MITFEPNEKLNIMKLKHLKVVILIGISILFIAIGLMYYIEIQTPRLDDDLKPSKTSTGNLDTIHPQEHNIIPWKVYNREQIENKECKHLIYDYGI